MTESIRVGQSDQQGTYQINRGKIPLKKSPPLRQGEDLGGVFE